MASPTPRPLPPLLSKSNSLPRPRNRSNRAPNPLANFPQPQKSQQIPTLLFIPKPQFHAPQKPHMEQLSSQYLHNHSPRNPQSFLRPDLRTLRTQIIQRLHKTFPKNAKKTPRNNEKEKITESPVKPHQ